VLTLTFSTSAIDVRSEKIVQEALDRVSKSRTTICIAHRLSTIMKADKIVVVHRGKVVEQGTHEELVAREEGMYNGFVRAQAVEALNDTDMDILADDDEDELLMDYQKEGLTNAPSSNQIAPSEMVRKGAGSFGILLYEQRTRWVLYSLVLLGAMGGGGMYIPMFSPCLNIANNL